MYELVITTTSPLSSAIYDPETGNLDLVFDWDKLLQSSGTWGNARHIDAVTFNGTPYEIEIHADDGPRDANGYIYNMDTMENTFTIDVGEGFNPDDGTIELNLTDRANGTGLLYSFQLAGEDDPVPPVETPEGLVYALNVGGSEYTAANGVTYEGDELASIREWSTNNAISGTEDDTLYQSERSELNGGFTYETAVTNGTYDIELNFAEIYAGTQDAGARVFDVYIEDVLVIDNLDIASEAGFRAAYDVTQTATVSDGSLSIELVSNVENAKLSAFSVWESDEDPTTPADTPVLVHALNAGGSDYTAGNGVLYEADDLGNIRAWKTNAAISGTQDDTLYQSERSELSGGFTYETEVANGLYDVELNFAEIWGGAKNAGVRVFDVFVEGEHVISDLDIADEAGFLSAIDFIGEVAVTDGSLTITVDASVQNAKLAGFSIWEAEGALSSDFEVGSLYDDLSF